MEQDILRAMLARNAGQGARTHNLAAATGIPARVIVARLVRLRKLGLVEQVTEYVWRLTPAGMAQARSGGAV